MNAIERLERKARKAFDKHGRIPLTLASRLMALGIIVPELEWTWASSSRS